VTNPVSQPVLIVGSVAFDDLEMPSGTFLDVVGGAATYCSIAASVYGPARIVGVVGEDFPEPTLQALKARGVDTAGVVRIAGGKTFRWRGRYSADLNSRETLDTQLNVFADFKPVLPESFRSSPYVLLGNIHPALQLDVLGQITARKFVAADTMNFWIGGEPALLDKVIAGVDLLVINDEEARQLAGVSSLVEAAKRIRAKGPKKLIIKRGEHGALLFDEAGVFATPAVLLDNVLDPTGAGDSFAGGLLGYLAANDDGTPFALRKAMLHASALGSFCVEAIGTKKTMSVTRAEADARVAELSKMLQYQA
jgi:sugar/nucleoside kinase (ribokinase family)